MDINGIDYLIYYIPKKRDKRYMSAVIYDIQKEKEQRNFIIIVDDIKSVNMDDFVFGKNQVLLMEYNESNLEKLKYLHNINWSRIVKDYYDNKVFLSAYNFCDYTDYKNKYVEMFYFLDMEKIYRLKLFLRENKKKNADIVCDVELKDDLRKMFPNAHLVVVDLDKYVDKVRRWYE